MLKPQVGFKTHVQEFSGKPIVIGQSKTGETNHSESSANGSAKT